jgi:hypothetical protein
MQVAILHLSDFHIKDERDVYVALSEKISTSIKTEVDSNSISHVFVVCTGDIAYSGTQEQYEIAMSFFNDLRSSVLNLNPSIELDFICCPGNHDCDFKEEGIRGYLLPKVKDDGIGNVTDDVREACFSHQNRYFDFQSKLEGSDVENRLFWRKSYKLSEKVINFTQVNTAWCSTISEVQGQLSYPFGSIVYEDCDLNITIMHHPSNWFTQTTLNDFRDTALKSTDILLTGHEHIGSSSTITSSRSQRIGVIEGGVLQDEGLRCSSFNFIVMDLEGSKIQYSRFDLDLESDFYRQGDKIEQELIPRGGGALEVSTYFEDFIADCGGYFKHPSGVNIKLSDIFVPPNLSKEVEDGDDKVLNTTSLISDVNLIDKNFIVSGGDNVGTTSLLRMISNQYMNQGYLLVYLNGSEIKSSNSRDVLNLILRKLSSQYESKDIKDYYKNLESSKKVVIVDDFDECPVKSEKGRSDIVGYFAKNFQRVILGVDDTFSINELTSDIDTEMSDFEHYKIQFFGYKKRGQLIRKWYEIGLDDDVAEAEVIANCTAAERLIESAMDPSLISSCPIYIITLLQGIDSNNSSYLKDASLGEYYRYLLTQSYLDVGVSREALRVEIDYAAHLANYMDVNGIRVLTEDDFIDFNEYFSSTWHESDYSKKLKILLNSKVLVAVSDGYRFKYSYNYYFLIAYYFSNNILNEDIQKRVQLCIDHLYLKRNANTVLFLSQQVAYDNILVMMKDALCSLFDGMQVADFSGRCGVAQDLILNAPLLRLDKSDPTDARDRSNEIRDQNDSRLVEGHVVEKEEKKNIAQLDLADRISMLFRSMDILVQIIKSNPTKYERVKKVEVLNSIIAEPLRALQGFYDHLEAHPRALVDAINHAVLQRSKELNEDQVDKLSRSVVARIIQGISASFVIKTAHMLNSEVVKPEMRSVITKKSSISQKLISLAINLDSSRDLPREQLSSVFELCRDSVIAVKVFEVIVYNRLHSYKTKAADLQWLSESFDFSLSSQKAVAFNNSRKVTKK